MEGQIRISIDRGGTFTDVYAYCPSFNPPDYVFKLLSVDPANYKDAPTEGIRRVLSHFLSCDIPRGQKLDLSPVESIRMGTTVATNALLERKGARTAFLVTKGFRDILLIGQQARPDIFDLSVSKMSKLYESVYEIDERVTIETFSENPHPQHPEELLAADPTSLCLAPSGDVVRVIRSPDVSEIRRSLQAAWDSGIRSVAICFMHSYAYPAHEQIAAAEARNMGFDVSVSFALQPMIKLVSRANSSTADAYLSPIIRQYIESIGEGFQGGLEAVGSKLLFMQSDGGLTAWSKFSGLRAILSGPAGGVVGYAQTTWDPEDKQPVLGFDMGGTSTDVSRYSGTLEHIFETTTAEVTIQSPQLDISTVAAGGGSILAWRNGLFAVGPESASANPGPACYRKGGPLAVTDANLFLGRLVPDTFPSIFGPNEDEPLDSEIVAKKFAEVTEEINKSRPDQPPLSSTDVALGFLRVANETMCRPIRSLTEGKGYLTAAHRLASFGGAGGQHATAVAENLGINWVVIHKYSSILSAYGMVVADVVAESSKPVTAVLDEAALPGLEEKLAEEETAVRAQLAEQSFGNDETVVEKYLNLRYRGTETAAMTHFEEETGDISKTVADIKAAFVKRHKQEYGFVLNRDIIVSDVRVRGVLKSATGRGRDTVVRLPLETRLADSGKSHGVRKVFFEVRGRAEGASQGEWMDTPVFEIEDLESGDCVRGPALILDATQTIVVEPGWRCTVAQREMGLILQKEATAESASEVAKQADPAKETSRAVDPIRLSVFSHRFMSIAEQMGQTLRQTAISTNIKERLDFSCAVFSPDGGLVANAPHIPIHLGSMASAVLFQKQQWDGKLKPGDVLVANHPAAGGSHLPDITVITPVFAPGSDSEIIFWTAARGHHSDIGGISAGSMPPFSKEIWEEGAQFFGSKAVKEGVFDEEEMVRILYEEPAKYPECSGSRSLSDSISDLKAQIAANNKGIQLIQRLIEEFGLAEIQFYMYAIQSNAEQTVRRLLRNFHTEFSGKPLQAEDRLDDGTRIRLQVTIDGATGDAEFDFTGTGPQVYGNLNAPKAITASAILYALRCMVSDSIPLNQGCLAPVTIKLPENSVLAPSPDAATVGGNVETSQRVTDVVLKAFGVMAASQGTCNNLTFGFGGGRDPKTGEVQRGFGYYETIAGGAGAGATWEGQDAVQVHMTNTRATDPEVLEKRYPCILHEFSVRWGSGGAGRNRGGNGVVRAIEFTRPVQVSILSERRSVAPFGLNGGLPGAYGENIWRRKVVDPGNGKEKYVDVSLGGKNTCQMQAGEAIIVKTPGGGGFGAPQE